MTKIYIENNLLNKNKDLLFSKLKKYNYTKEEIYNIYYNKTNRCENNHELSFISFSSGYKECKICNDLLGFYNLDNIKEYSKSNTLTATQTRKIKLYHDLDLKDIYLLNNQKEYCPICNKESIFKNQTGYAITCSQKCSALLPRTKLTKEKQIIANEKRKSTCIDKYNTCTNLNLNINDRVNPMSNPIHKEKRDKTMIERYGSVHPLQNKDILLKFKQTHKNKDEVSPFGEHPSRNHFTNIKDYNETFIENNFIDNKNFKYLEFEKYFNTSGTNTLKIMRYFGLWQEKVSMPEQILSKFLSGFIKTKKVISPYELDFYSDEPKIAFEVNGDYWHSIESGTKWDYHKMKTDMCDTKGVKLYQFFENEIINKQDIVESLINNILNKNELIIYTDIVFIDEVIARKFIDDNYIEYKESLVYLGIYNNDILMGIVSFNNNEIIQVVPKKYYSINGLILNNILNYYNELYRYNDLLVSIDRRYEDALLFEEINFSYKETQEPKVFYYKNGSYSKEYSEGCYTLYDSGSLVLERKE